MQHVLAAKICTSLPVSDHLEVEVVVENIRVNQKIIDQHFFAHNHVTCGICFVQIDSAGLGNLEVSKITSRREENMCVGVTGTTLN